MTLKAKLTVISLTVAVSVGLSGCVNFRNRCLNYGYQPGTDGFAYCMQTEKHHVDSATLSLLLSGSRRSR